MLLLKLRTLKIALKFDLKKGAADFQFFLDLKKVEFGLVEFP